MSSIWLPHHYELSAELIFAKTGTKVVASHKKGSVAELDIQCEDQ
jgi:hypothetical protein